MKMKPIADKIKCKDGVSLSVQASRFHYSSPRDDDGPYTAVEVGFIQDADGNAVTPPDSWREYAEGEFPNDVYAYVPVELVEDFITSHGGRTQLAPGDQWVDDDGKGYGWTGTSWIETPIPNTTNQKPRFIWTVGAYREEYPDVPDLSELCLWDRRTKQAVVTLHANFGALLALETTWPDGAPISDMADWCNSLSEKALASEGLPGSNPC